MNKRIVLVTGGQRSGKSLFAEKLAIEIADGLPITYLATAEAYDDEMRERVRKHQLRRGHQWVTIEDSLHPSSHAFTTSIVLVECLTMLSTNIFLANSEDVDASYSILCHEIDALLSKADTIIFVTNEIGFGGTSANDMQRKFTDLLGLTNRYVAEKANEVYLLVCGIPLKIKDEKEI